MKKLTFAFIFAALAFTAPAQAETMNCTPITALPAVITVQGIYCFTADLATAMTSGNAIDIQTSNVVLDLNGFKLGGLGAGLGTLANGIVASDRQTSRSRTGRSADSGRRSFCHIFPPRPRATSSKTFAPIRIR